MTHPSEFRFCPRCGAGLAPRRLKAGEPERLACAGCGFIFFFDPKLAAGTICPLDGGIVLVRRSIEPGYGKWVLPGGYVDRGEAVAAAAIRETREEASLEVAVRELVNVYSYPDNPVVVVVYLVQVLGGELRAGDEALEARIFPPGAIPWDELAFPSTAEALRDYLGRFGT
ncbi:MAG TPA: NUDIX hydrolase [Candidatus Methylomirabilis sp.]|jgi:ADP-ribose pyrophosphatase YjhB (NUDIX family)|nr:NUDIX hydrolase [Candidatus Methylomirabilis sp.]